MAGVVNPGALGQSRWLVRLRCRPGGVAAIADALANRDDVNWVALTGLQSMEVSPVLRLVKQAGTRLFGDRLVEPSSGRARR